ERGLRMITRELATDILIVGGGLGGVAAALSAVRLGRAVILTEPSDWLGGQLTAQAVPPDEHPWIEHFGCTASYRRLREGIRAYYRRNYPLLPAARSDPHLNPGLGWVSRLCHEPRVALAVIEELLAPYRAGQQLRVLLQHVPIAAERDGDRIRAVTLSDQLSGAQVLIQAAYVLDATELGDLLELGGVEHVVGAESQAQTGEPHALSGPADPFDQQAISWCFALDYLPGEDHTIARPADYDFWRAYQPDFWPGALLSWIDTDPVSLQPRQLPIFDGPPEREYARDFWHYRRIFSRKHYPDGAYPSDITLVNWPQIDYWLGPLIGVTPQQRQAHLRGARQLSFSMLYWMQTEAPRFDGGYGYRGLRLRPDIVGTSDGLAKHVYIRESRRIKAEFTVLEQHVGVEARTGQHGAEQFPDTVGIGSYRIDLHPSTSLRTYVDIPSWPFQLPLGALIPIRVENLLPACKNIGTTHITNGCYRLHPVEWNIGEVAGALAAYCLDNGCTPRQVRNRAGRLHDFQQLLQCIGVELAWPDPRRSPQ
ncbi:MAG TPA: FAD-dependent oxidoreductase, partial [Roseiflexaceae bacterium]|nr:FAD-dependent oxidoreductase [Roseiflexaceae bacterium]